MTYHHDDPQECFEHAIFERVLSNDPEAVNFAARFMYMHSDATHDHFKHIETRCYIQSPLVG